MVALRECVQDNCAHAAWKQVEINSNNMAIKTKSYMRSLPKGAAQECNSDTGRSRIGKRKKSLYWKRSAFQPNIALVSSLVFAKVAFWRYLLLMPSVACSFAFLFPHDLWEGAKYFQHRMGLSMALFRAHELHLISSLQKQNDPCARSTLKTETAIVQYKQHSFVHTQWVKQVC